MRLIHKYIITQWQLRALQSIYSGQRENNVHKKREKKETSKDLRNVKGARARFAKGSFAV